MIWTFMKIALITHIESDLNNLNTQLNTIKMLEDKLECRLYEKEAIKCFTCWRKNAGWLKDIPIYCLCATKNTISEDTKKQLALLNVNYIEDYNEDTQKFSSGFLTIPYVGYYFENINKIDADITIKIDLDNFIFKPIQHEIVEKAYEKTVVGQYPYMHIKNRASFGFMPFDTSVIITHCKNNFYKLYYDLCFSDKVLATKEWKETYAMSKDYWLEEVVVDYIYYNKLADIEPLTYYQYGRGYPTLAWFIRNKRLNSVFLRHEHLIRK